MSHPWPSSPSTAPLLPAIAVAILFRPLAAATSCASALLLLVCGLTLWSLLSLWDVGDCLVVLVEERR